jgi:uncharacterized membrane protein
MLGYFLLYILTVPVFFAIDMVWLGLVANKFYFGALGDRLMATPNWPAAILFYLLYIVGILIFVVVPAHAKDSVQNAIVYGGLFGFFCYATYDLTNYSTMKNWPLNVTLVDMAWGVVLTGTVSLISFYIAKYVLK